MSSTAETLMTNRFLRISTQHTLREALGLLLYGEEKNMDTGAIVVIDTEGEIAGILTPDCLVRGFAGGKIEENEPLEDAAFLERVQAHMPDKVDSIMHTDLPLLTKTTPFAKIIHLIGEGRFECLPVMEEHRVVGLVYAADVFKSAANAALSPDEQGIQLPD